MFFFICRNFFVEKKLLFVKIELKKQPGKTKKIGFTGLFLNLFLFFPTEFIKLKVKPPQKMRSKITK